MTKHLHDMPKDEFVKTVANMAPKLQEFMVTAAKELDLCIDCAHKLVYLMIEGYIEDAVTVVTIIPGEKSVRH